MPTVSPNAKVLVTGANGYIALWVVRALLEHGYHVRGTVRSEEKGAHLKKIFSAYNHKFELVVVPDITKVSFGDFLGANSETVDSVVRRAHSTKLLKGWMQLNIPLRPSTSTPMTRKVRNTPQNLFCLTIHLIPFLCSVDHPGC